MCFLEDHKQARQQGKHRMTGKTFLEGKNLARRNCLLCRLLDPCKDRNWKDRPPCCRSAGFLRKKFHFWSCQGSRTATAQSVEHADDQLIGLRCVLGAAGACPRRGEKRLLMAPFNVQIQTERWNHGKHTHNIIYIYLYFAMIAYYIILLHIKAIHATVLTPHKTRIDTIHVHKIHKGEWLMVFDRK